ncbi:UvrD-helicase domain-containing protein [Pseudoflavitalea sp. G-6-1-2]|uniref:UvrD-helicase domain-containing protein n=1 Tax=Pseudoflavitalea sp. G-6-1-2 TaxID=2728841 RepID=UPI00146F409C|nr:UvrD-helicase domain-containing protein [Pseudoflavitalea sp. G-6-1-2]NML23848.1 UvrD-helicase domain-containing protein [Pseudoflavitalea sp. G-6-1-2]
MSKGKKTLTEEQLAVISSSGNIAINAVAGSGKTTTIIEYAASRPGKPSILYLAFNRSVKIEAMRKFEERGLSNVRVETAHSLAFDHIVRRSAYKVRQKEYKTHEIVDMLGLTGQGEKHNEYVIATHIIRFISYFCNSDKKKVQELNYLDTVTDETAKTFVKNHYTSIEHGARQMLAKMDKAQIEITHDFYLKKFQLAAPQLPFHYILFDEAQDASAAMLDVILKQRAIKLIVGDTHQQIYGWRHAVNSLEKTGFETLQLSNSFRFPQEIASLATEILEWKNHLQDHQSVGITGKGSGLKSKLKATIARTNLGLLLNAIEFITNNRKISGIYFEGNFNSYTYADEGASLYDVLNLQNNKPDHIRDKLISGMRSMEELEEYIEKTEDPQLAMMVEIVKEYGDEIYDLLRKLKQLQLTDEHRDKADMIFSTVHRAKGMEYDTVHLVNDFISESKIKRAKGEAAFAKQPLDKGKLNEEINLLYVALTRAKNTLHIPEPLVPEQFPVSPRIILTDVKEEAAKPVKPATPAPVKKAIRTSVDKTTYLNNQKRDQAKAAYKPWSAEEDADLINWYEGGSSVAEIAELFKRTKGAIIARLKRLSLLE